MIFGCELPFHESWVDTLGAAVEKAGGEVDHLGALPRRTRLGYPRPSPLTPKAGVDVLRVMCQRGADLDGRPRVCGAGQRRPGTSSTLQASPVRRLTASSIWPSGIRWVISH